jgi:RNA polymerase sigma-70 factor (ECF subfamily)
MFTKVDLNQYYRYCLSLTKNEEDAYDLLQTGLEKYLKKNGPHIEQPKSYLYRIFRNQFIDNVRKNKRWGVEEYQDRSNIALLKTEQFDDILIYQDEADRILSYLPVNDRELLYLWAVEGFTVQEIADFMEVPKGTLLSRLHRIKKRLRDKIDNPFQKKEVL